ncbi:MAG: glycosyltransferase family 2 protein [Neisseria sp.]|nr:glycosyltransferase family 2 protein [Neisseria sp.]
MQNAQLDVIIPCYNAADTLERAVLSVLRQAEVRRVVLVDDGSSDGTRALMQDLAARFAQIQLEFMPQNGGVAKARNWGALQSDADFIAFLDADDEYENGVLLPAFWILQHRPEIALVRLKIKPIDLEEKYLQANGFDRAWQSVAMTVGGNMVFRRNAFLAAGGFPQQTLFRQLGGEDAALGIAFTRASVVATLFGEREAAVRHYCHANAHARRLLDAHLFGQHDARVHAEQMAQAEAITAQIVQNLHSLQSVLNVPQTGIMPMYPEYN